MKTMLFSRFFFLFFLIGSISLDAFAQNIGINATGSTPDSTALLDVSSTSKGVLIPRLSTTQRTTIAGPATSLMVFDTNTVSFWFYNGTVWEELKGGTAANDTLPLIIDADRDTYVHTEQNTDEDIIRFNVNGTERWTMENNRLLSPNNSNNIYVGDNAHTVGPSFLGNSVNSVVLGNHLIGGDSIQYLQNSVAIGNGALAGTKISDDIGDVESVGVGYNALRKGNTNTWFFFRNTAVGSQAMDALTRDPASIVITDNTSLGAASFGNLDYGHRNTALGASAGINMTNGNNNVFVGYSTGSNVPTDGKLFIDNSPTQSPLIWGDFLNDSLTAHGTFSIANPTTGAYYYSFPNGDGATNQVLQTNGAGQLTWATTDRQLIDADTDTKVQVEETADEDLIRFDLEGTERWVMTGKRLEPKNSHQSVYIGENVAAAIAHFSYTNNVAIGQNSMTSIFGESNVSLGAGTMSNTTNTALNNSWNVAIGYLALQNVTGAAQNVAIGSEAGKNVGGGEFNTYLGSDAGYSGSGSNNVMIGWGAGAFETGSYKLHIESDYHDTPLIWGDFQNDSVTVHGTFSIGNPTNGVRYYSFPTTDGTANQVLQTNGTGQVTWATTAMDTLPLIQDADRDTKIQVEKSIDEDIIHFDLSGTEKWVMTSSRIEPSNSGGSVFIGTNAGLVDDLTNNYNTFIGINTGSSNTTGFDNIFMGPNSGIKNTTGNSNTFLGGRTGVENTSGNYNTFLGHYAGWQNTTGSNNSFLGKNTGFNNTTGTNNVFAGMNAGQNNTTANSNTFIGVNSGQNNTTGWDNVYIGFQAGQLTTTGNQNTFVGMTSGGANTTGQYNTYLGHFAGRSTTTGSNNTFLGKNTGFTNSTGVNNAFVGMNAGQNNTTGGNNVFLGVNSGQNNTIANGGTFIGMQAGQNNTTAVDNVFLGLNAGRSTTTGGLNIMLGAFAGEANTTNIGNVYLGWASGQLTNATGNTMLGFQTGRNNTAGSNNLYVGYQTGLNNQGSNNLFLGYLVGSAETTTSNQLFVDNSNTSNPLIWGDFGNDSLTIHGTLSVANPTSGASYYSFPNADGTVNQVLQTNGMGQLAWGNATLNTDNQATDVFQLNGNNLELSIANDGVATQTVDLSGYSNTDAQDLVLSGNTLSVTNDASTVNLAPYLDNTDNQAADVFQLNGNNLELSIANDGVATQVVDLSAFATDTLPKIKDGDGDTKIEVGVTADDDIIRFSVGNAANSSIEYFTIDKGRIQTWNTNESVYIGEAAGETANYNKAYANTHVGRRSGMSNDTSIANTGFGWGTLESSTSQGNTAMGSAALWKNVGGTLNNALGWGALQLNISGSNNASVGALSLYNNINGDNNTAMGNYALYTNTEGFNNAAVGRNALYFNETGTWNAAMGRGAVYSNSTGTLNVGFGAQSLYLNDTGSFNSAVGVNALFNCLGDNNTALGQGAGFSTTGSDNVFIGYNAGYNASGSNELYIDNSATVRPLIYGDFSADFAAINGSLAVGRQTAGTAPSLFDVHGTVGSVNGPHIEYSTTQDAYPVFHQLNWNHDNISQNFDAYFDGASWRSSDAGTNFQIYKLSDQFQINYDAGVAAGGAIAWNSGIVMNGLGNVGIGTANLVNAKLEVNGAVNRAVPIIDYFTLASGGVQSYGGGGNGSYSIWASDRIAAAQYEAFSDVRIKDVKGVSNGDEDLAKLMKIEVTNYQYKDKVRLGDEIQKKVIAQQVKSIYPQAVSTSTTRFIPSIYKVAEITDGWVKLSTDLKVGDRVKIMTEKEEKLCNVLDITEGGFKIELVEKEKIFVYGKEVHDFHTVDYEALSTLNISATQELAKRLLQLEKENSVYDQRLQKVESQEKRIELLESKIEQLFMFLEEATTSK